MSDVQRDAGRGRDPGEEMQQAEGVGATGDTGHDGCVGEGFERGADGGEKGTVSGRRGVQARSVHAAV